MPKDKITEHFNRMDKAKMLTEYDNRTRSKDDIEEEKELIDKTEKVEPLRAEKQTRRNDPCPCGSGKKFKKCCAMND